MKRITSFEIRCLKNLLKIYRDRNVKLQLENNELRKQLEESRAKEGKGCLEKMLDGIADAISSIDFSAISAMNHPELLDDSITIEGDDDNAI